MCVTLLYVLLHRELSYVLDLTPDRCNKIDERKSEGIEVSLGNWNRDGNWIPLAYHDRFSTNDHTIRIRDYDVPYYNDSGVQTFKISVCGDDYLRDGLQIRWLQQVTLTNKTNKKRERDVVTLNNVSISLIVNETSISLLEDGFDQGNLRYFNLKCIRFLYTRTAQQIGIKRSEMVAYLLSVLLALRITR